MNPQVCNNSNNNIYKTWKFIYNDCGYPNLPQYHSGYYINLVTKEKYAFRPGIKNIVGEDNEQRVYDMWWVENG